MNPTFSSPRNLNSQFPNTHSGPFYNPQHKDSNPQNFAPQTGKPLPPFLQPGQSNSKSYQYKQNFEHAKPTGNSSAYLKSAQETATSATNFPNFTGNYSKIPGEMTKSSFHDHPRMSEAPAPFPRTMDRTPVGTPPRRQPRFSEPGNLDSPYEGQDTKGSFIPYGGKGFEIRKEDSKEMHFYKKPLFNSSELPAKAERIQKPNTFPMSFPGRKSKTTISLDSF
jgi:hypothetical protein